MSVQEASHQELVGYAVEDPSGQRLGRISAVRRAGPELCVHIRRRFRRAVEGARSLPWMHVAWIDLINRTLIVTAEGAAALAAAPSAGPRRAWLRSRTAPTGRIVAQVGRGASA